MVRSRSVVRKARKVGFWKRHRVQLAKPRLCVFRSSSHIVAQVFNDVNHSTLVCASSVEKGFSGSLSGLAQAQAVGRLVGERLKAAGIDRVVFDRNGFTYHGRVKALADSVRQAGIIF